MEVTKAQDATFSQDFEARGEWWAADEPNRRVPGILSYTPSRGLRLELIGTIQDPLTGGDSPGGVPVENFFGSRDEIALVHGVTTDGDVWSLGECVQSSISFRSGRSVPKSAYRAHIGLAGETEIDVSGAILSSWSIELCDLPHWLATPVYSYSPLPDGTLDIRYQQPAEIQWPVQGGTVSVEHDAKHRPGPYGVTSEYRPKLRFDRTEATDFDCGFEHTSDVALLIELLVGHRLPLHKMSLAWDKRTFHVFYKSSQPTDAPRRRTQQHRMFATFPAVEPELPDAVSKWVSSSDAARAALRLAHSALSGNDKTLHMQFLLLAQLLEALHRATSVGRVLYSDRCHALLSRLPTDVATLFGEPARLVRAVVATRNLLTHHFDEDEDPCAVTVDDDLFYLVMTMRAWCKMQLLDHAGFTAPTLSAQATAWYDRDNVIRWAGQWRTSGEQSVDARAD